MAAAGPNIRVVVELNDMTYSNHFENLVDRLQSGPVAVPAHMTSASQSPTGATPPKKQRLPHQYKNAVFSAFVAEGEDATVGKILKRLFGREHSDPSTRSSSSEHARQAGRQSTDMVTRK